MSHPDGTVNTCRSVSDNLAVLPGAGACSQWFAHWKWPCVTAAEEKPHGNVADGRLFERVRAGGSLPGIRGGDTRSGGNGLGRGGSAKGDGAEGGRAGAVLRQTAVAGGGAHQVADRG